MHERDSILELMEKAHALPWGKACSAMWVEAAKLAQRSGEQFLLAQCYLHLINALAMSGESSQLLAPFLWLDKFRKERPDLFDAEMQSAFGWQYKYILGLLRDFPSGSSAELKRVLSEMKKYYLQSGDGLKSYYIRCYYAYWVLGRHEEAEEYARTWESILNRGEESEFDDCAGCDPMHLVALQLTRGNVELAVAAGERGLADTGRYCDSQPESLYTAMLVPWLRCGHDDKAWPAHVRALQRNIQQSAYIEHFPEHFRYLALSAAAGRPTRWERGVELFTRYLPWWCEAETPRVLLNLATSVAFFFYHYPDQDEVFEVTLPGSLLPWFKAPNVTNPTAKRVHQWCADIALGLAAEFDSRPGMRTPFVLEKITAEIFNVEPIPELPPEGDIPDVSGHFAKEVIDYAVRAKNSARPSGELVAVDTRGEWREFSEADLQQAELDLGSDLPSIYSLRLGGLLIDDAGDAMESEDARMLLVQALDDRLEGDWEIAIENATEAMHTQSSEPIGVRLQALYIIANCYLDAGQYAEAVYQTRHCLNLAAALGLPQVRAQAAELMALTLRHHEQWSELAEVATLALQAEGLDASLPAAIALRRMLVEAFEHLDLDSAAAKEAYILAELVASDEEKIHALEQVVRGQQSSGEYYQAAVTADQISEICHNQLTAAIERGLQESEIRDRAKAYADRLMAAVILRSNTPGRLSDMQFAAGERDLQRRFSLIQEHLVPEEHDPRLAEALYYNDRGNFALACRRFEAGMTWLLQAHDKYLELGQWVLAAGCSLHVAEYQMEQGNREEAYKLALRTREMLSQHSCIHGVEYNRSELLIHQFLEGK